MNNVLVDGEIVLHGTVGGDFWGEGFTPRDVLNALVELGRNEDVTVRINSGGGIAIDGVAIYNALASHAGHVTVYVEGIAASAASIIAMGGDTIIMRTGTLMMIHDPSSITWGTAQDHEKSVEILDKLGSQLASIYAERTGESVEAMREAMKVETWLTADEAIDQGFADKVESEAAAEATAFDYRLYERAPESLVAMATAKSWGPKTKSKAKAKAHKPAPVATAKPREKRSETMPKETTETAAVDAGKVRAEERTRIGAIVNDASAKGKTTLATYLAYETEMPAAEAIEMLKRAEAKAEAPAAPAAQVKPEAAAASILGLELANEQPAAKAAAVINTSSIYASRRKSGQAA